MKTLKSVVDGRMIKIEKQMRGDVEFAKSQLPPGQRSPTRIMEIVAKIEADRAANELEKIQKNLSVVASVTGEVREALEALIANRYRAVQDAAINEIDELLELAEYRVRGKNYIDDVARRIAKERYEALSKKHGGNGHGER